MSLSGILRIIRLPLNDKILLAEAASWIMLSKIVIRIVPMSMYQKILLGDLVNEAPPFIVDPAEKGKIEKVTGAIKAISKKIPGNNRCYTQAVTAKKMLSRSGINSALYLGAAKNPEGALDAHAWVRCGDLFVIGGEEPQKKYSVLGIFT